jgi:hypothetical protein
MTTEADQIDDLMTIKETNPFAFGALMGDFLRPDAPIIDAEPGQFDGAAVVLTGPAASDPDRIKGLVDVLTTILGPRKLGRRCRCYQQGTRGGWSPIRKMDDWHEEVNQ